MTLLYNPRLQPQLQPQDNHQTARWKNGEKPTRIVPRAIPSSQAVVSSPENQIFSFAGSIGGEWPWNVQRTGNQEGEPKIPASVGRNWDSATEYFPRRREAISRPEHQHRRGLRTTNDLWYQGQQQQQIALLESQQKMSEPRQRRVGSSQPGIEQQQKPLPVAEPVPHQSSHLHQAIFQPQSSSAAATSATTSNPVLSSINTVSPPREAQQSPLYISNVITKRSQQPTNHQRTFSDDSTSLVGTSVVTIPLSSSQSGQSEMLPNTFGPNLENQTILSVPSYQNASPDDRPRFMMAQSLLAHFSVDAESENQWYSTKESQQNNQTRASSPTPSISSSPSHTVPVTVMHHHRPVGGSAATANFAAVFKGPFDEPVAIGPTSAVQIVQETQPPSTSVFPGISVPDPAQTPQQHPGPPHVYLNHEGDEESHVRKTSPQRSNVCCPQFSSS